MWSMGTSLPGNRIPTSVEKFRRPTHHRINFNNSAKWSWVEIYVVNLHFKGLILSFWLWDWRLNLVWDKLMSGYDQWVLAWDSQFTPSFVISSKLPISLWRSSPWTHTSISLTAWTSGPGSTPTPPSPWSSFFTTIPLRRTRMAGFTSL